MNQISAPLALRKPGQPTTRVRVGDVVFGGARVVLIGGPCAVENRAQVLEAARYVKEAGGTMLRGGAWKPRTSPYSFQGLGAEGLPILQEARRECGLPVVSEVLDPRDVPRVAAAVDMLQIGSRNIQNFPLLQEVGASGMPVLLKRGMMTTVEEWLLAAEYILEAGGRDVVLCERGIRTFDSALRNTLDVGSVVLLRELTHLPVIVDPSHACGNAKIVPSLARAAVAAGADGLLVEMHPDPDHALSDGTQSLDPASFLDMAVSCAAVARAIGREF